jgi:hypothetical protein
MSRSGFSPLSLIAAALLAVQPQGLLARAPANDGEALASMHALAKCLFSHRHHTSDAALILAYPPRAPEGVAAFQRAQPEGCAEFDGTLSMKDHFLRGAIAEELLHRQFGAIGKPLGTKVSPIFTWPDDPKAVAAMAPQARIDLAMIAVGECVTKMAPDTVFAFLSIPIGTPAEQAAIRLLLPQLQACISQGTSIDLNFATVRAFLGEGAYRVSVQRSGLQP